MEKNHYTILEPLLTALAHRGHQIVKLQASIPKTFNHPNVTEILLQLPRNSPASREPYFSCNVDPLGGMKLLEESRATISKKFYTIPEVMELYRRRREFDLVITGHLFNEMAFPFCLGVPCVMLATAGIDHRYSAMMGNVLSPAFSDSILSGYPQPYSFFNRVRNLCFQLYVASYWQLWGFFPIVEKELSPHLPDIPPLTELERNVSLMLSNSYFSLTNAVPLLPSQVEVAGIHCHPGQPLPQDLREWVDGSGEAGVVYFSLGTVALGNGMPASYRRLFLDAFALLTYRVIWKFESNLEDVPSNVLVREWLPQQDLLSDPRVRVFISHAGMFSTVEAVYHATPVLALPIFADQPRNADNLASRGFGLVLHWEHLTVDLIADTIIQLAENPRYLRKISEGSRQLRDQMESPLERAVFWTEYVARHRGAPQLKSPAAQLTWIQFLMLDVAALILTILLVFAAILFYIHRCLTDKLTRRQKGTQ